MANSKSKNKPKKKTENKRTIFYAILKIGLDFSDYAGIEKPLFRSKKDAEEYINSLYEQDDSGNFSFFVQEVELSK